MSYGDYLEQLTYLLFLKMDDEGHSLGKSSAIADDHGWPSLLGWMAMTLRTTIGRS